MNKKQPIVSVIMPVHNAGIFLAPAIESIRRQTEANFELLIIDDGSTDRSWSIMKQFARRDARIRIFRNEKNLGLVKSLNFLIPKTKGTFVARMDADDVSLPDRFEKQISYLQTHPRLVACGGQEEIINERGRIIAKKYFPTEEIACYNMIANIMVIQPPLLMAHGHIFRKLRYDNKIFRNDDISIHFKLLEYGQFGNVDRCIFQYRHRPNSLTHANPKKVYFLALLVRVNAMLKHNYRPSLINILLAVAETMLVAALPNKAIIHLFELVRLTQTRVQKVWRKNWAAPKVKLATLAKL